MLQLNGKRRLNLEALGGLVWQHGALKNIKYLFEEEK
jgi:hypothetical protein